MERSIGRPAADLSSSISTTGARTKLKDRIEDRYVQASPGGRYLLYLHGDQYWTIDTTHARDRPTSPRPSPTSFVDRESDATSSRSRRSASPAGRRTTRPCCSTTSSISGGAPPTARRATRLTDGAAEQVRHRYVRLNPDEEFIDRREARGRQPVRHLDEEVRLRPAERRVERSLERLVWLDKA